MPMSTLIPPDSRDVVRDALAMSVGIGVVGASFGATAAAFGTPWWQPVVTALVLNLRHFPYGLAVGDVYWGRWWSRLLGTHLLLDQSTAFALAAGDDRRRAKVAFWATGAAIFLTWNIGTVVGYLAGERVGDPDALGLDAAFPAALLALVIPRLREKDTLRAVALGAVIALATSPFLPAGVPVLLALVGLVAVLPRRRRGDPR